MVRYLLSGVVMVGAVVVFLAGALGNVTSLPDLSTVLSNSIARMLPDRAQVPTEALTPAAAPPPLAASSDASTAQPVIEALNQQLSQLQRQADQRGKELDALRAGENAEQQRLTALQQQRQAEEAAVAQLQAQHQQLEGIQKAITNSAFAAAAQQKTANAALQKESRTCKHKSSWSPTDLRLFGPMRTRSAMHSTHCISNGVPRRMR